MTRILAGGLGILLVGLWPQLPPLPSLWLQAALAALGLALLFSRVGWLAAFTLGVGWGIVSGHALVNSQLPVAREGDDFTVVGEVAGLPEHRAGFIRFEFRVDLSAVNQLGLPERLLLSWYDRPDLAPGERWQLRVRLRAPRGSVNQGGFDYQRWLLSRGIGATGYVRESPDNRLLGAGDYPLQRLRANIREWIAGSVPETGFRGPLTALVIGDRSAMSQQQWAVFRNTGTSHLMAISGLHVGLAALFGFWFGHGLRALLSLGSVGRWSFYLPALFSCGAAAAYSAVAGFALPTQRALIMVVVLNVFLISGRSGSAFHGLAWAWLLVLCLDPLAGYDLGFWLSFGAVFALLFSFQGRRFFGEAGLSVAVENPRQGIGRRIGTWFGRSGRFGRAQWVVFIGLFVPLVALNLPVSLVGPIANLVVIPLVSFLVVLPLLVGVLCHAWFPALADGLLWLANGFFGWSWAWLAWLDQVAAQATWFPQRAVVNPLFDAVLLALGLAGACLLLLPRGIPGRWLGWILLLPVVIPALPERAPLQVTVLDVGQGLAVVVQTREHALLYDTGPGVSDRFNAGEAIVLPYLRTQGIRKLDALIVSHADNDHAGGLPPLLAAMSANQIRVGEFLSEAKEARECDANESWHWDGVDFALLEPTLKPGRRSNDHSCILLIRYGGQQILLPGDIESRVERNLLADERLPKDIALLLAPHHGSRSSSSAAFVAHTHPAHVVYSAGYNNRYGHPHPVVVGRYAEVGASTHHTGVQGQIDFRWNAPDELTVHHWREVGRRYWYAPAADAIVVRETDGG